MRNKILIIALAALVGVGAAGVQAWTQDTPEPLAISEVVDGLYVIVGSGGNVAVRVTDDGVVVVDNKFEQNYDEIMERIRSVTNQPVRYVLNTHHHGDHSGGNVHFAENAQIIGHENVRANIIRGGQAGPPPITFSGSAAVFVGDVEVQAHHVGRGHTNGDAVILFPDLGVIHTGDLFVSSTPYMDYGNGGSGASWVAALNNILELDFDTVIPGHGPVLSKADIREFRNKFETLLERADALISEGVTADQFAVRLDTSDLGWNYSEGFVASSIPNLYNELNGAE